MDLTLFKTKKKVKKLLIEKKIGTKFSLHKLKPHTHTSTQSHTIHSLQIPYETMHRLIDRISSTTKIPYLFHRKYTPYATIVGADGQVH